MSAEPKINPRYVAWAAANGRTPEAQLEADRAATMVEFSCWIQARWRQFAEEFTAQAGVTLRWSGADPPSAVLMRTFGETVIHASFDRWLAQGTKTGKFKVGGESTATGATT